MSLVTLVSGGLDSTLIGVLAKEKGIATFPLFIDYGQRALTLEWNTCKKMHSKLKLPKPKKMGIGGFGKVIVTGLTSRSKRIKADAFTPTRNLLFVVCGAAYAYQVGASGVAIGLLSEKQSIFPDQTAAFIESAQTAIHAAIGMDIKVLTPLSSFSKADVVRMAKVRNIVGTYSCHAGLKKPCGRCISCLERRGL